MSRRCRPSPGIILIVAAGGGFKQVLVDSGIGTLLADWAKGAHVSVHRAGLGDRRADPPRDRFGDGRDHHRVVVDRRRWSPGMPSGEVSLVVLAVGAGSLFFSHVNDAGFWLVNQYFGLTVGQTIKTWSIMETVLSVSGLARGAAAGPGDLTIRP